MKYLLTLILSTMLFSCNVHEGDVIKTVTSPSNDSYFVYETVSGSRFYARPFVYNVGDTVWFTKK